MSLSVPTEILFDILQRLDRKTLCNLRIINHHLCQVVTEVLFQDLNIHYGLSRSIAQMRAIIDAPTPVPGLPVRLCVKKLFLPSESFFPRAQDFKFQKWYMFEWSQQLPNPHPKPDLKNNPKPSTSDLPIEDEDSSNLLARLRAASLDERAVSHGDLPEDPKNQDIKFDLKVPEFMQQFELYEKTTVEFLKACENLQQICIAQGIGWGTERMKYWTYMVTNTALPTIAPRVREMSIMVARMRCGHIPIISDYLFSTPEQGGKMVFSSLKSLDITIHSAQNFREQSNKDRTAANQIANFLLKIPNIDSFGIANTALFRNPGPRVFSPVPESVHLTSLSLCTIFIPDSISDLPSFEDFKAMIISRPAIKNLEMEYIVLYHPSMRCFPKRAYDPATDLPAPKPDTMLHSRGFEFPPWMNWAAVFELLRKRLLNLTSYRFRHLMYGGSLRRPRAAAMGSNVLLFVPMDQEYRTINSEKFADVVRVDEMISPYLKDYSEMEAFKQEIDNRRKIVGLGGGGGSEFLSD
ncbi:hypothetical protein TWF225_009200 [Orbilia oligospora]|nr:hypothetical protein TWF225_009200 [Orbilia oligospora]KAF3269822.1 hypothetical protein TWF217_008184 [Orbilia oligospora]KAF3270275.1 hypothetical protein TWF128_004075 [Orbilia oligospora]